MRFYPLLLAIPFLTTFAPLSLAREPFTPSVIRLEIRPVALRPDAPDRRRLGALRFLQGWWLRSNDPRFGGLSAMHVEGAKVTALSDSGRLYTFAVPARAGPAPLRGRFLRAGSGGPKEQRDTEAMVVHGASLWVSYERQNRIRRYDRASGRVAADARPAAMRDWPLNSGGEAMLRLSDGRFLILAEGGGETGGTTPALLFEGDPADQRTRAVPIRYRAPAGFRVTDAAALPDGRLLILNRRVSLLDGIQVKLVLTSRPDFRKDAVIAGREIAHFEGEVTTDNYEALSITRERGRTILWIASDDNFMAFQRTLLMKFELDESSRSPSLRP